MSTQRRSDSAYIDTDLWVPKGMVNVEGVKNSLTFTYLEGAKREEVSLPLYFETQDHIIVPREYWSKAQLKCPFYDCRPKAYKKIAFESHIQLDHKLVNGRLQPTGLNYQHKAVEAMLGAQGGILQLACGKGKSVIALEVIARLKMPALIVVDNTNLLDQWRRLIEVCLTVPGGVGYIQADKYDWKKGLVLATYQTLALRAAGMPDEVRRWFGATIWDEAHHLSALTFSKSANLFYGRRYGLSATPKRADGLHVIQEFHVGKVLYKDLTQDIKPDIQFIETPFSLDLDNPAVAASVTDSSGEINLGLLYSYLGTRVDRLQYIVEMCRKFYDEGRKILVLSNSVAELSNLLSTWNGTALLSAVRYPSKEEIGYTGTPAQLSDAALGKLLTKLRGLDGMTDADSNLLRDKYTATLLAHEASVELDKLYESRRKKHIRDTFLQPSTAGILMQAVKPSLRDEMLRKKRITFAITKYGKEGLDDPALDTVMLCSPMSSQAMLQQVMGRVQRPREGKKSELFVILEDKIGPLQAMCYQMRRHLRQWPLEDGGPYTFKVIKCAPTLLTVLWIYMRAGNRVLRVN